MGQIVRYGLECLGGGGAARGVGAADVRPSVSIIKGVGRRDADLSNLKQTTCVGGGG